MVALCSMLAQEYAEEKVNLEAYRPRTTKEVAMRTNAEVQELKSLMHDVVVHLATGQQPTSFRRLIDAQQNKPLVSTQDEEEEARRWLMPLANAVQAIQARGTPELEGNTC